MTNFYPEKPIVQYMKTSIEMSIVIDYLKRMQINPEIKRSTYIIFRNESANGKSGICNNYCGFQADGARWPAIHDDKISGVVVKKENGTGKERLFLAFKDFTGCIDMLTERVEGRGLYVGGDTHKIWTAHIDTPATLAIAYKREWVTGSKTAQPSEQDMKNFLSMYKQAASLFI